MSNWCITNITIETPNAENLVENIKKWTTKDFYKNDFGNKWLGNVIAGSNIAEYDGENFYTSEGKKIGCKGWIDYFFIGGHSFFIGKDVTNEVHISTETAWGPYLQMWLKIIDKYYPEAKLTYHAEETNMGVYLTNDDKYVGKYILEIVDDLPENINIEDNDMLTADELEKIIYMFLPDFRVMSTKELLKYLAERELECNNPKSRIDVLIAIVLHHTDYISIHQWQFSDPKECD